MKGTAVSTISRMPLVDHLATWKTTRLVTLFLVPLIVVPLVAI